MAEYTLDELKEIPEIAERAKVALSDSSFIQGFSEDLNELNASAGDAMRTLGSSTGILQNLKASFDQLSGTGLAGFFSGMQSNFNEMISQGDLSREEMVKLTGSVSSLFLVGSGRLELSNELTRLAGSASEASTQLSEVYAKILPLVPYGERLSNTFKNLGLDLGTVFAQSDMARNLETAFLRQASAAGELDAVLGGLRNNFDNLGGKVIEYTTQLTDIATANNISFDSAVRLSNMLREIPGGMDTIVVAGSDAAAQMNLLDGVLKVASGTFQDFETVMGDVNMLFQNFGEDALAGSLEYVARMSQAAQQLRIPMDTMRSFVQDAASQFRFLGDNTNAAINIMARMGPALRESGLGPQGIRDIVAGMVRATSQLDVAQRAFVSAQTGGPGGLQGGYELALLQQQGRSDEVLAKVEETLRQQFGGDIVTLEQAALDPRAAAQMARQVQLLTTGPLAVAGSEAEAFKILDAFARGLPSPEDAAAGVGPGGDVLADTVERGNDIQGHQLDALNIARNELEKQSVIAAFSLDALRQMTTGQDTDFGQRILQEMQGRSTEASRRQTVAGVSATDLSQELEQTLTQASDLTQGVLDRAGDALSNLPGVGQVFQEQAPTRQTEPVGPGVELPEGVQTGLAAQPASDIAAGAFLLGEQERQQQAAPERRGQTNTLNVVIRSDDEIKKMIKVELNQFGEIIGHEEVAGAYGQTAGN